MNYIKSTLDKIDKKDLIDSVDHKDHVSLVYHYHIVKVYQQRIHIIYIRENGNEEEIIRPGEVDYINQIISDCCF